MAAISIVFALIDCCAALYRLHFEGKLALLDSPPKSGLF